MIGMGVTALPCVFFEDPFRGANADEASFDRLTAEPYIKLDSSIEERVPGYRAARFATRLGLEIPLAWPGRDLW
jgi:hypothetical protein